MWTNALILLRSARATTLRARAILLSAKLADVAALRYLDSFGVAFGKIGNGGVAMMIVFGERAQQHARYLGRDAGIPLLWRVRRLVDVRVPHLFQALIDKRWATGQQFVGADG